MNVCFYFQVHQPMRLAPFSIFSDGHASPSDAYFDANLNSSIMRKVANKCYLPTNRILLEALEQNPNFKIAFSTTGVFLEQAEMFSPEVIESFQALAKTGQVEFLSETYYHSLSALFPEKDEFVEQINLHKMKLQQLGLTKNGSTHSVFRNTEAMFSNDIAYLVERLGYKGIMAEGFDTTLGWRSPTYLYSVKNTNGIKAMLRHYKLSDDIGYRFSARWWNEYPLTADKYARWLSHLSGDCVNLFMDYETFGEHHWEDTGIFGFLRALPGEISKHSHLNFTTPSELASAVPANGEIDVPHITSWADMERDTSAWLGNDMQRACWSELTSLEAPIKELGDPEYLRAWRHLQNSDHLYYCCTKSLSDQDVHNYFSPYDSPFESFINYMNVLQDLKMRVAAQLKK